MQRTRQAHRTGCERPGMETNPAAKATPATAEMRRVWKPALQGFGASESLANTAREFSCGLLLIHHLRKRGAAEVSEVVGPDDFRGSGHIMAMARSVMALSAARGEEEDAHNGPRRLEVIKTNLARHPRALGLALDPGDPRAPALRYGKPPEVRRDKTQVEECGAWLVDLLDSHDGMMRPKEVIALAREEGFHERMVYRARRAMEGRIQDSRGKRDPDNLWMVCGDEDEV